MEDDTAWSEEKAFCLIDAYRVREILWNPQNENYFKKNLKQDAWSEIAKFMTMTVEKCNRKIVSLLSSYRREKLKEKKSKGTGKVASETYISRWFAYDALKFLDDRNTPRKRNNTESLHRSDLENTADQNVFTPPVLPNECTPKSAKQTRRDDNVLSDVMGILKTTANKLDNSIGIPDTTKSFASFIGAKMTSYSPQTRTSVEHAIFEIIMKADRGYYESWRHQNNRPSISAGPPSGTNEAGPYGYTTARNEDTTDYPTIQPPLSACSRCDRCSR
ncbi:hypothetical protein RR48_02668 [Papilio machaon]|uniref:MADF domain-containing protein n=1 Tax=Papilio machaon TaxID=76193 RepID=A0A0N1IP76_PAPMA|nr:hypothetical protein RR48_02668 [Papilio machaon]